VSGQFPVHSMRPFVHEQLSLQVPLPHPQPGTWALHGKPLDTKCPDGSHMSRWSLLQGPTPAFVQVLADGAQAPPRTHGSDASPASSATGPASATPTVPAQAPAA